MQLDSFDLLVKDKHIKIVDSQKLLGIITDKSLTLDKHVGAVCLNVSRRITLLTYFRNMLIKKVSINIINHTFYQYLIMDV